MRIALGSRKASTGLAPTVVFLVSMVAVIVVSGAYVAFGPASTSVPSSSTTTSTGMQGIVTGYVTVGPSQPLCQVDQPCTVNMTGYSLVFTPKCPVASSLCQPTRAQLGPGGHYSILLPAGEYTVSGLYPSCTWMGCSSAFPKTVAVESGMQLVYNVDIDTGIR